VSAAAAYPEPVRKRPPFADASPAEVRAALIPEEVGEFDRDMADAARTRDRAVIQETLESWRRIAWMTTANGPDAHRRMWQRAAAKYTGDDISTNEPLQVTKARLGY
jgi:hypothetical protein